MSASMHFGMALAQGEPDPSYANETADLHRPVLVGTTHALETTMPRLRPQGSMERTGRHRLRQFPVGELKHWFDAS